MWQKVSSSSAPQMAPSTIRRVCVAEIQHEANCAALVQLGSAHVSVLGPPASSAAGTVTIPGKSIQLRDVFFGCTVLRTKHETCGSRLVWLLSNRWQINTFKGLKFKKKTYIDPLVPSCCVRRYLISKPEKEAWKYEERKTNKMQQLDVYY